MNVERLADVRLTQDKNEMTMQTRVLIAEDRRTSRSGLRVVLAVRPEIVIVGEAAYDQEAVRLVAEWRPVYATGPPVQSPLGHYACCAGRRHC